MGTPIRAAIGAVSGSAKGIFNYTVSNPESLVLSENAKTVLFISRDIASGKLVIRTGPEIFFVLATVAVQAIAEVVTAYVTFHIAKKFLLILLAFFGTKKVLLSANNQRKTLKENDDSFKTKTKKTTKKSILDDDSNN